MDFRKREADLDQIFYKIRMRLANLSDTAPTNKQVILRASCFAWELKQKYRGKGVAYYVPQRSYLEDLDRIRAIESGISQGESDNAEALMVISELREYLDLIAGYRVRNRKKTRVY